MLFGLGLVLTFMGIGSWAAGLSAWVSQASDAQSGFGARMFEAATTGGPWFVAGAVLFGVGLLIVALDFAIDRLETALRSPRQP